MLHCPTKMQAVTKGLALKSALCPHSVSARTVHNELYTFYYEGFFPQEVLFVLCQWRLLSYANCAVRVKCSYEEPSRYVCHHWSPALYARFEGKWAPPELYESTKQALKHHCSFSQQAFPAAFLADIATLAELPADLVATLTLLTERGWANVQSRHRQLVRCLTCERHTEGS